MKMTKTLGILAIIAAFLLPTAAQAQLYINFHNVKNDSVEFVEQSTKSHPGGWNFDIIGMNVHAGKKGKSTPDREGRAFLNVSPITLASGWGFGFTNALNAPAGMDVTMGRSFNFCLMDAIAFRVRPWRTGAFSVGVGLDLRNYKMLSDQRFVEDPVTKKITLESYPEGSVPGFSKVHTGAATFNLKYIQKLGRGFNLAFGPELSVVAKRGTNHRISTTYTDSQGEQKEKFKGIRTNKVGFNLVGIVNYKNVFGLYAKYSPSDVLQSNFGPQFQSLSVGLLLFGL